MKSRTTLQTTAAASCSAAPAAAVNSNPTDGSNNCQFLSNDLIFIDEYYLFSTDRYARADY